jgi:hypothetical protein
MTTTENNIEFEIRHGRAENLFLGLFLICPLILIDVMFLVKSKDYTFLIFCFLMTLFVGWFAYNYIRNGIRRKLVIAFDKYGLTSFEPNFKFSWQEVFGYKLYDSGKTVSIEFIFDNGRTSTKVDVTRCDKKANQIDSYLSTKIPKYKQDEYEETFEKSL